MTDRYKKLSDERAHLKSRRVAMNDAVKTQTGQLSVLDFDSNNSEPEALHADLIKTQQKMARLNDRYQARALLWSMRVLLAFLLNAMIVAAVWVASGNIKGEALITLFMALAFAILMTMPLTAMIENALSHSLKAIESSFDAMQKDFDELRRQVKQLSS